jgi:hypothetical protein
MAVDTLDTRVAPSAPSAPSSHPVADDGPDSRLLERAAVLELLRGVRERLAAARAIEEQAHRDQAKALAWGQALGVPVAVLAREGGFTRDTAYKWLDGAEPPQTLTEKFTGCHVTDSGGLLYSPVGASVPPAGWEFEPPSEPELRAALERRYRQVPAS